MALNANDFKQTMEKRFKHKLGTKHAYPLVTAYAKRFVGQRFALIGDAAVGMHPVTAHGFNFGARGASCLAGEIKAAQVKGRDIASAKLLTNYEKTH